MQGFFVVCLHPAQAVASLPPIKDPDPFITNDLMDGRDSFLATAREKHYEFSSLRRAKFSTMAMLYELHTQAKDFVYTCNSCKATMESHYHCDTCDVSSVDFVQIHAYVVGVSIISIYYYYNFRSV